MLIPRRISRNRIWRDFLQSMAAFMGLSALLFFCGSVFRVTPTPAGRSDPESLDSALLNDNIGQQVGQYRDNGASAVGFQRHNRALQFMDSKNYGKDSLDSNEISVSNSILDNTLDDKVYPENQRKSQVLEFGSEVETGQPRAGDVEINIDSPNPADSSFYLDEEHKFENINDKSSSNQVKEKEISAKTDRLLSENKDDQLSNIPSAHNKRKTLASDAKIPTFPKETLIKRLPKAIIIGAKKAGTRALLEFLRIHPSIEGTGPEPHFFDRNYDKGLDWYRELMPKTAKHQITIEKTPGYFVTRDAPKRIFEMDPTIKLILVVRDPVTRAISDYCQAASKHPMRPFEEMALLDERLGLVNTSWGAIKIGVYAKHMEHWLQMFSMDQIHLVDGQKLIEEPARELGRVETFLGIPKFINDSHFYLRGFKGTFPCLIRDGKPHCLDEKTKGRDHPVVKESVLQRLRDFYRPFNAKFFQMVGRTFEWS